MSKVWLVEIRFKDWVRLAPGESPTVTYEEVEAPDEYSARHAGFSQFEARTKYEPITRRRYEARGCAMVDYCAPDAVEL